MIRKLLWKYFKYEMFACESVDILFIVIFFVIGVCGIVGNVMEAFK